MVVKKESLMFQTGPCSQNLWNYHAVADKGFCFHPAILKCLKNLVWSIQCEMKVKCLVTLGKGGYGESLGNSGPKNNSIVWRGEEAKFT